MYPTTAETFGYVVVNASEEAVPEPVGMAVVGCVIFLVACFCPMVLFRLLAFVDPGTASVALGN